MLDRERYRQLRERVREEAEQDAGLAGPLCMFLVAPCTHRMAARYFI
jgi:hypothetical protein